MVFDSSGYPANNLSSFLTQFDCMLNLESLIQIGYKVIKS